jgi:hypothetical protein
MQRAKRAKRRDIMDELVLKVTGKEMDVIANALGTRPYIEVAQLLQKLSLQIKEQQHPPAVEAKANGNDQPGVQ